MSEATGTPIGQVIDNRYRITRKIAEGGMATVYTAIDNRLGRTVAIKIMHTQLAQGPHRQQFVERFQREARSAAAIANPHIVQIYDTGEFDGLDYLVMEYVHGVNLRYEMNQDGPFTVRETLRILTEILDGLSAAHNAGIVHRDIKPENILLNDRGRVQITDFGLAKAASQATLATTGMLLGTAAYLAPEMIENNLATSQGDLYSVGIMAWEMLTGSVPFVSDNPVTMVFKHVHEDVPPLSSSHPGIPPAVSDFISHLTARQVADRPRNASEALSELLQMSETLLPAELTYRVPPEGEVQATTVLPVKQEENDTASPAPRATTSGTARGDKPTEPITDMHADRSPANDSSGHQNDGAPATSSADESTRPAKSRKPLIIGAIIVFLLAAIGGGFAWWYYLGPGSYWEVPAAEDVACQNDQDCSIVGANFETYERTLKVVGIPYSTPTEQYSDTVPKGDIISASPSNVGSRIGKRSSEKMTFVVSKGVKEITIPDDILDANSDNGKDPINALKKLGFDSITHDDSKDEYSMTIPAGAAISITPEPGTTIKHNEKITVSLSKGLMPVSMPDLTGKTESEAQAALQALRLKGNFSEQNSDSIEAGRVISSSEKTGTELHWGDTVNVILSKGPKMADVPNVVFSKPADAQKKLEALGFKVKLEGSQILGLVQKQSAKGQTRLHDTKGNPTVITLTVV